jgi:hypothetical protein
MKYPLLILALVLFTLTGKCQIDSTVFDFLSNRINQDIHNVVCSYRGNVPSGSHSQIYSGHEFRGVTGNPKGNYTTVVDLKLLGLPAIYSPQGGWHKSESSFTIKYHFKAGYKYTFAFTNYFSDSDPNYGPHPPTLQAQLTNSPDYTNARDCYSDDPTPEINLISGNNPNAEYVPNGSALSGVKTNVNLEFRPDIDYEYVWIAAKTNAAYQNFGWIDISKIVIYESLDFSIHEYSTTFCPGTTNTYTLYKNGVEFQGPNSVTWTTTGQLGIQGSNSNNTAIVINNDNTGIGTRKQVGTLTATINTQPGKTLIINKEVIVGDYPAGDIWGFVNNGQVCLNTTYNAGLSGNTYSRYNWTVSNGTILSGQNTPEITYRVDPPTDGTMQFYITCHVYSQTCDLPIPESLIEYATIVDCGPGGGGTVISRMAYPNPANNNITITTKEPVNSNTIYNKPMNSSTKEFNFSILDKFGKIRKRGKSINGDDINVDVTDIPSDTYFLHIEMNNKVYKKQIIIRH